jgi:hypothetical protein
MVAIVSFVSIATKVERSVYSFKYSFSKNQIFVYFFCINLAKTSIVDIYFDDRVPIGNTLQEER